MFAGCSWFDKNFHFVFAFLLYYLHFTLSLSIFTLFVYVYDYVSMSTSRFTAFHLHLIMWSIFKEHFHYNEPFNLIKVDTCFSLIVFAHFLEYPLYFCLYQETPTWKNPTQEIPPWWIPVRKIPTWNIPTHAFEYCHPRFLMFLFFHCHRYHWHYLKDYFVVVYFKSAAIRNSGFDVWKKL